MLDFERNVSEWTYTNSAITNQTHKIYTWKTTPSAVYFHILVDDNTPKHIFLKYTTAANQTLMKKVQSDGCAKSLYTTSVNSSTVTMKKDDTTFSPNTTDNQYKFFRTWSFSSTVPGFFGFMEFTLKKQYYDLKGKEISTPAAVTTTYAVKTLTGEADQTSTDYTTYPNGYYCLVNSFTTQHIDITEIGTAAGDATASNLSCKLVTDNMAPLTVGTESFAVSELNPPF